MLAGLLEEKGSQNSFHLHSRENEQLHAGCAASLTSHCYPDMDMECMEGTLQTPDMLRRPCMVEESHHFIQKSLKLALQLLCVHSVLALEPVS